MRVVFRVDASYRIGSGHVMRCLALADGLRRRGDEAVFVSRAHPGHLASLITQAGFSVYELRAPDTAAGTGRGEECFTWLGVPQATDATETARALQHIGPADWLVVDHYALDKAWESELRAVAGGIAVLDDLADRDHDVDLLIDPTLGREPTDYRKRLPAKATLLLGPGYAPLRSDFARLRSDALARRGRDARPDHLLVNLGGADPDGATVTVLQGLAAAGSLPDLSVEIVLGANAADSAAVRRAAAALPYATKVDVGVDDLAERMVRADLAIGACGTTSWERCCLGLPALVITIAPNQYGVAAALERAGAIEWIGDLDAVAFDPSIVGTAVAALLRHPQRLHELAEAAGRVTDGGGVERLVEALHRPPAQKEQR